MSQTLSVSDANMNNYTLSITTRDNGDSPEIMEELTFRTIKIWLWIASNLEQKVYKLPDNPGSVESRYAAEINKAAADTDGPKPEPFAFVETFGDARVTIWDTFKSQPRIGFHLNSDDDLQIAVDTWLANHRAIERAMNELATPQQKVQNAAANTPQGAPERPAKPKATNAPTASTTPQNGATPLLTKKDAIAKLQPGDNFKMKIVQIEKHSKDGADFYDFYEPYGGKAGQFSAVSVFVDNEIAVNNGLIAYLDTLGIKLGQALVGSWVINASVGKPKTKTMKGEEKTFVNIYINSFEGQPEQAAK